ncbi:hypothetical protein NC651_008862 [Populus alba x Populus x berolinensis]|nr:hypothetical protein NC651_008862 [Populus alba x Populus x berolinensis]
MGKTLDSLWTSTLFLLHGPAPSSISQIFWTRSLALQLLPMRRKHRQCMVKSMCLDTSTKTNWMLCLLITLVKIHDVDSVATSLLHPRKTSKQLITL